MNQYAEHSSNGRGFLVLSATLHMRYVASNRWEKPSQFMAGG